MPSTMNPVRTKKTAAYVLGVIAVLLFLLIYFDPSSSAGMVNKSLNFLLRAISAAVFIIALAYCFRLGFSKIQLICLVSAIFIFFGTFFINIFESTASGFMIYGLNVAAIITVFYLITGKMDMRKAAVLIIAGGCIMRIGCGMAVPTYLDRHDYIFASDFSESYGHAKYIGHIVQNLSLPQDYVSQNYHPPLHHIMGALFYGLTRLLGFSYLRFAESFQLITGLYSCLALMVWYRIFHEMGLRKGALLKPLAILAFHPTGWLMGGCLNNDMLMWLLASVCLLYLIKWRKEPNFKNILIMAVSLGLAMMTKVSAVLIAPAIALVFLYEIYKCHIEKRQISKRVSNKEPQSKNTLKDLFWQLAAFGCVSIPLGMWYPVRNLLKFGQSFGYVPSVSEESTQYIGDLPFAERLFSFPASLFDKPFVQWDGVDFNFFVKVQKTALFGEETWLTELDTYSLLAGLLTLLNCALVIISLVSIVYVLIKARRNKGYILYAAAALYYITLTLSHIYFSYRYPFQCTNDVRYVAVNIGIGLLFTGKMLEILKHKREESPVKKDSVPKMVPLTVSFCLTSVLIYFLDSFYRVF